MYATWNRVHRLYHYHGGQRPLPRSLVERAVTTRLGIALLWLIAASALLLLRLLRYGHQHHSDRCCCLACRSARSVVDRHLLKDCLDELAFAAHRHLGWSDWPLHVVRHCLNEANYSQRLLQLERFIASCARLPPLCIVLLLLLVMRPVPMQTVCDCLATAADSTAAATCVFCRTGSRDEWQSPPLQINYTALKRHGERLSHESRLLRDAAGDLYYVWFSVDAEDARFAHRLVSRRHLFDQLERLRTLYAVDCVCPALLGLIANATFLYDRDEVRWLTLLAPDGHRDDRMANVMESSVHYAQSTPDGTAMPLYDNFDALRTFMGDIRQRHYAHFYVDYSVANETRKAQPEKRYASVPVSSHRHRRLLTAEQAVCFAFCDASNRRLLQLSPLPPLPPPPPPPSRTRDERRVDVGSIQ
jgi:hypothetical protein